MTTISRGVIAVDSPEDVELLKKHLRVFSHGTGEYENLYSLSHDGKTLTTMPGFAARLRGLGIKRIHNMCMPMPMPKDAAADLEEPWRKMVSRAVAAEGGIVSLPHAFAATAIVGILRSYPREGLMDRGTPLSIVAVEGRDELNILAAELREALPERDVGRMDVGTYTDSEDIIVATYRSLKDLRLDLCGIFIGDALAANTPERIEAISSIRNAARWGLHLTCTGGDSSYDLVMEGLFGPFAASATYADAVHAGTVAPVTVCWLEAPRPGQIGSADPKLLGALAMQENPAFVKEVVDVLNGTSPDVGCLVACDTLALAKKVGDGKVVEVHSKTPAKRRKADLAAIAAGTVRKAVFASDFSPRSSDHGVMVMATCGGREAIKFFPWRTKKSQGDRTYIVDFRHGWDFHNGRPGVLARNDESRVRRYAELGFGQMRVSATSELPFLNR